MNVTWVERNEIMERVSSEISAGEVVLDVGAGIRPQSFYLPRIHICVDVHRPYLERLREEAHPDSPLVFLNCTWEIALQAHLDKSVDSVFAIDFIEHLAKEEGVAFLQEAKRVARKQVVVFTPLGFYPQCYENPSTPDRWGMDGGYWQTHRSGWRPEDFNNEWQLYCCRDYHKVDQYGERLSRPIGAMWAILNTGEVGSRVELPIRPKGSIVSRSGKAMRRVRRAIGRRIRR